MRTLRLFGECSPAARMLLINQLGVQLGFYLLIPYLIFYFTDDLGLSAALAGTLLGVRTLAQQGLTLVGGTLADRIGCRPVIIAGCALRTVAFAMFALFDSLPGVIVATVLTGLAGALFNPAVRTYVAAEAQGRRVEVFALFTLFGSIGTLTGPLLGSALLILDFRVVSLVATLIFAVLTIAQLFWLPRREVEPSGHSVWRGWAIVATDWRFLLFTVAASVSFALMSQLFLAMPLEMDRLTGVRGASALVFTVSTVITVVAQLRISQWFSRRWAPGTSLSVGLLISGLAFVPLLVWAVVTGDPARPSGVGLVFSLVAMALATGLLGFGFAVCQPFSLDRVHALSPPGLSGTYFGIYGTATGLMAAAGSSITGYLTDLAETLSARWLIWLFLVVLGLVGGVGMAILQRSRSLETYRGKSLATTATAAASAGAEARRA